MSFSVCRTFFLFAAQFVCLPHILSVCHTVCLFAAQFVCVMQSLLMFQKIYWFAAQFVCARQSLCVCHKVCLFAAQHVCLPHNLSVRCTTCPSVAQKHGQSCSVFLAKATTGLCPMPGRSTRKFAAQFVCLAHTQRLSEYLTTVPEEAQY